MGDITNPPDELQPDSYDLVYALNNTLGYIPDAAEALRRMRLLSSGQVVLSLFSDERFTDDVAFPYFASMGIDPASVASEGNTFYLPEADGGVTPMRRFSRQEVLDWGAETKPTPLGFYALLAASH